jgi:hypothetical protein
MMVWFPPQSIASLDGLPWPVADGPLVVYHPAAHRNHTASLSLALEAGRPLLHVSNDLAPWWPEGSWPAVPGDLQLGRRSTGWMNGDEFRLYGPPRGAPSPVWPLHAQGCAWHWMRRLPSIDVLYLDWTDWFQDPQVRDTVTSCLGSVVSTCLPHLRSGALVIVDQKTAWPASFLPSADVDLNNGAVLRRLGELSWLDLLPEVARSVDAVAFTVEHAMQAKPLTWRKILADIAPEVHWSQSQCQAAMTDLPGPCPDSLTPESWDMLHAERMELGFHGVRLEFVGPRPTLPWTHETWSAHLVGMQALHHHSDSAP